MFQLSVDTYHPETAERALAYGVTMINCVKVDAVPAMLEIVRKNRVDLVIPAIFLGSVPLDLGSVPGSEGSVPTDSGSVTTGGGVYLDPMIGFGTTREEDLALLQAVPQLAARGPVLVGASRKRIVKKLTGVKGEVGKSIGGNVALAVWAALKGASVVRVHDVRDTVEALRVVNALEGRS